MTDVTNRNRVQAGVSGGGQFAKEQAAEAAGGPTALAPAYTKPARAVPATRQEVINKRIEQAERYLAELHVADIRNHLVETVRELPEDATTIDVIDWSEEAGEDGSYDITLGDVQDEDGSYVGHCSDYTIRIDPNSRTSPDGWDAPFRLEDEDGDSDTIQLDVAEIRQWGARQALAFPGEDAMLPSAPFFSHDDVNYLEYVPPLPKGAPEGAHIDVDSSGNEHTASLWSGDGEKIASFRFMDSENEYTDNVEEFSIGEEHGCLSSEWAEEYEEEIGHTLRQIARNADFASSRAQSRLRGSRGFSQSVSELAIAGNPEMEGAFRAEHGL